MIENRYSRQIAYWGETNQRKIKNTTVFVAGLGGLGGILCIMLARAGIGKLIICDKGIVDTPDLNRQSLYFEKHVGCKKIKIAKEILNEINSSVEVITVDKKIDEDFDFNFKNLNIVADCLDNYKSRLHLYNKTYTNTFYVHGGVDAITGQVLTLKKGFSRDLSDVFAGLKDKNEVIPVTPETVNVVASVMVREIFNIIIDKPLLLDKFWIMSFEGLFADFMKV